MGETSTAIGTVGHGLGTGIGTQYSTHCRTEVKVLDKWQRRQWIKSLLCRCMLQGTESLLC